MRMRKILITLVAVLLLTGCGDSTSVDESSVDTTKTDINQIDTTKTEDEEILEEAECVGVFGEDVFFNNIGDYVGCEFDITMIYNVKDADGKYVFTATEKTSTGMSINKFRVTDKTENESFTELENYNSRESYGYCIGAIGLYYRPQNSSRFCRGNR